MRNLFLVRNLYLLVPGEKSISSGIHPIDANKLNKGINGLLISLKMTKKKTGNTTSVAQTFQVVLHMNTFG